MISPISIARACLLCAILARAAHAANLQETKKACLQRASLTAGKHWLEECVIDIITLRPVHPVFRSLGPGTGTAFGIGYDSKPNSNTIERAVSVSGAIAPDHSYVMNGSLTIGFPPLSIGSTDAPATGVAADPNMRRLSLVVGNPAIDAKAALEIRARRVALARQDFYGIGSFTSQSNLALYRYRETAAGFTIGDPLTNWLSVSFSADYIRPEIGGVNKDGRPSILQAYTETSAPGVSVQHGFLKAEPHIHVKFHLAPLNSTELRAGYAFYHDTESRTYSFRRFQINARTIQELLVQTQNTAANRTWLSKLICSPRPAKECSLGSLEVAGGADFSQTSRGSVVPFYFQPTLGGTDLDGRDTLRGYRDYRFRAPNRMYIHGEYRHDLPGLPVGVYGFYDVGRVAVRSSDLEFSHLRHDIGMGVYFSAAGNIVLRLFVGFGTGEGVRPNFKTPGGGF